MPRPKAAPSWEQQLENLRAHGFQVKTTGADCWQAEKGRCAVLLESGPEGARIRQGPGYLLGGEVAQLVDGGYQKFLSAAGRRLPATAEHLRELHAFQEELCAALGLTSLYNQSLGTVSHRYHYDRVKGRE